MRLHRGHKDKTFDEATGAVNKEWKQMAKLAIKIRENRGSPVWIEEQEKKFTGIFKRLLEDPIEEVRKESR